MDDEIDPEEPKQFDAFIVASMMLDEWLSFAANVSGRVWPPKPSENPEDKRFLEELVRIADEIASNSWKIPDDVWVCWDVIAAMGPQSDVCEIDLQAMGESQPRVLICPTAHECAVWWASGVGTKVSPFFFGEDFDGRDINGLVDAFRSECSVDFIAVRRLVARLRRERAGLAARYHHRLHVLAPRPMSDYDSPEKWRKAMFDAGMADSESSWIRFRNSHGGEKHPKSGKGKYRFPLAALKSAGVKPP